MAIQSLNSINSKDSMSGVGATNVAGSRGVGPATGNTVQPAPVDLTAKKPEPALADVQKATKEVQQAVQTMARNLQFSIDQESGKTIVKLTDSETGETIRQFPSQDMIDLAHSLDRLQGLLLKQQA